MFARDVFAGTHVISGCKLLCAKGRGISPRENEIYGKGREHFWERSEISGWPFGCVLWADFLPWRVHVRESRGDPSERLSTSCIRRCKRPRHYKYPLSRDGTFSPPFGSPPQPRSPLSLLPPPQSTHRISDNVAMLVRDGNFISRYLCPPIICDSLWHPPPLAADLLKGGGTFQKYGSVVTDPYYSTA